MTTKGLSIKILPVLRKRLEDDIVVLTTVIQEKTSNIMVSGLLKSLVLVKYNLLEQLPVSESEPSVRKLPVSGEKVLMKGYSSKYNLFLDDCDMITDILRDTEKNQMDFILNSEQESEMESSGSYLLNKIVLIYENIGIQLDEIRHTKEFLPYKLTLSV